MSSFIKYSFIAIGIQVVATAALILIGRGSTLLIVIDFYYPTILLVTKLGGLRGESTMMLPVFLGVPLGILLYGVVFGLMLNFLKNIKK